MGKQPCNCNKADCKQCRNRIKKKMRKFNKAADKKAKYIGDAIDGDRR